MVISVWGLISDEPNRAAVLKHSRFIQSGESTYIKVQLIVASIEGSTNMSFPFYTFQQQLDGLLWNLIQPFIVRRG